MAIPDTLAARLIETVCGNSLSGQFLMLGRQRWIGSRRGASAALLQRTIERYLPDLTESDLTEEDSIYADAFFRKLGFDNVSSMDISSFEDASIVQDLSGELTDELLGRFDVIYDGGTVEHIFNAPKAFANIDKMLKPGGVLIGHSPCNGWPNHGFYQFTPELVFSFWEKKMGYEVLHVRLQPLMPRYAENVITVTNPNQTGVRSRFSESVNGMSTIIMDYAVVKQITRDDRELSANTYQGAYELRWDGENVRK